VTEETRAITEYTDPSYNAGAIVPFMAGRLTRDQVELIKATVAKGATDDELALYLYHAQRYDLDPFRHEIWCIRTREGDPMTIFTGRDGYLKIAMRDPGYAGIQSFVVKEGDDFEIDAESGQVRHKFRADRNRASALILGAWARARHTDRPDIVCFVEFSEYNREKSPSWKNNPSAMICKVAEVFALRRQYNVSGLVAYEEVELPDRGDNGTVDRRANAQRRQVNQARAGKPICNKCKKPVVSVKVGDKVWTVEQIVIGSQKRFNEVLCYGCAASKMKAPSSQEPPKQEPKQSPKPKPEQKPPPPADNTPHNPEQDAERKEFQEAWENWTAMYRYAREIGVENIEPVSFPVPIAELRQRMAALTDRIKAQEDKLGDDIADMTVTEGAFSEVEDEPVFPDELPLE